MNVLVIGAGVSGLSCALRLLQAGHSVDIWTRDLPQDTTSSVAAALWYPYLAEPMRRVLPWSAVTFKELVRLSENVQTGVIMRDGCEIFRRPQAEEAWWRSAVPSYRRAMTEELPEGFADGYFASVPIIDMSIYLGWLEGEVRAQGAMFTQRSVTDVRDAQPVADIVVNCTGVGAREVSHDFEVYGVRGQVQVVKAPGITRYFLDDEGPTYIIPRVNDVVLGGTAQEHEYDTAVNTADAVLLRARCDALMPELANAPLLRSKVGIRPCRVTVRLEEEEIDGLRVIHNYGHGGAGVTLSWGCADE
ncbi:MAG: FAD-dependent oxidoreductase, partial [Gemmatimonadaceae bacterium]